MLANDLVKIKYSEEGYLPDYPYHLISNEEMLKAFVLSDNCFFDDWYPLPCESLEKEYLNLKGCIQSCCEQACKSSDAYVPDWVYSYMLGNAVNVMSGQKDVHDLLVLLNLDNVYDEFNERIYQSIFDVSVKCLGSTKLRESLQGDAPSLRPPTMFGEPHIIKYLRLEQVNV